MLYIESSKTATKTIRTAQSSLCDFFCTFLPDLSTALSWCIFFCSFRYSTNSDHESGERKKSRRSYFHFPASSVPWATRFAPFSRPEPRRGSNTEAGPSLCDFFCTFLPDLSTALSWCIFFRRIRRKEKEQKILFPFPSIFRSLGDSLRPVLKRKHTRRCHSHSGWSSRNCWARCRRYHHKRDGERWRCLDWSRWA
jgi:hypothetical protein